MTTYKCRFCDYKVTVDPTKKNFLECKIKMCKHYENKHKQLLPENMDGYVFFYYTQTGKDHGSCVICHNPTDFNYNTIKFGRFCNNPQCKQKYKEERDKRMMGKYGKIYLTDDPEMQRKMLENRKISGVYNWSDGKTKFPYVGSYELNFLKYLDLDKHWPAADVMIPSPHTYTYKFGDEDHFYIPDVFIPSMNCEIEIKSKARMEYQNQESRAKEIEKNKMMESCSNMFNYIILFDNDYTKFEDLIKKEE